MGGVEKLITKLAHAKGLVSEQELIRLLTHYGYHRVRFSGSHVHYERDAAGAPVYYPVHNGKVKHVYVRDVIKTLTSLP